MTERTFIPGSPWLYFKLYTGQKSADDILIFHLYPLVRKLKEEGNIQDFFFIRYSDPAFHLRVRFFIPDKTAYGAVFNAFYDAVEPCVRQGTISQVQCDTYQRELERYGSVSMETVERIFGVDSLSQLELLQRLTANSPNPDKDRWPIAFRLIDDLLEAFAFDGDRKIELLTRLAENYRQEFGFTQNTFTKQLNDKYRLHRQQIAGSFQPPPIIEEALSARKRMLAVPGGHLLEMEQAGTLEKTPADIVYSLLHMTMNRWFRSKNRIYEMVIYDFLLRHYKSAQAQAIYRKNEAQ